MYKILICDDEKDIVSALKIYLENAGYETRSAYNGREALAIIQNEEIHLALLDIMMPEIDGLRATELIREISNLPIILLTAKSEETDKILGLGTGADDYITKPFLPTELVARVRSQLRRYMELGGNTVKRDDHIEIGTITMDDTEKLVTVDGAPVSLTPTEYEILKLFMQNPGILFSPKEIYKRIWKDDPYGAEGTVAVHIRHLREKIELCPAEPRYLKAIWGQGYKIEKSPK
ncbi:MAG: response regulator transcription factor [Clostridia bacterium]|nr:response regulator transcription factor [Clostridia bacterium]MBP3555862.1 response regulator transcription factor [Clostridia bacterium]MBQ8418732.1 response regulator transcription factor [Clostridia bacterium]